MKMHGTPHGSSPPPLSNSADTLHDALLASSLELKARALPGASRWCASMALATNVDDSITTNSPAAASSMRVQVALAHASEPTTVMLARGHVEHAEYMRACEATRKLAETDDRAMFMHAYSMHLAAEKARAEAAAAEAAYTDATATPAPASAPIAAAAAAAIAARGDVAPNAPPPVAAHAAGGVTTVPTADPTAAATAGTPGAPGRLPARAFPHDRFGSPSEDELADVERMVAQRARDAVARAAGTAPANPWAMVYWDGAFLCYAHACLASAAGRSSDAAKALATSTLHFPWNWEAWEMLVPLDGALTRDAVAGDAAAAAALHACGTAAHHPVMAEIYRCAQLAHRHEAREAYEVLSSVRSRYFPESDFLLEAMARALYAAQDYDGAQGIYESLYSRDEHNLTGVDTYSNILYVKERYEELSHVAHRCQLWHRYAPESCCVIGNYYSLRGHHEKAARSFQRALRLDRRCVSAWTLLGHEFVEMKNPAAAVSAYRNAVAARPDDYRAWYGLGQTYEVLSLPQHALYYFRKATALRPNDGRMWCAMAQCLESPTVDRRDEAALCYRRAIATGDPEGLAVLRLARLYQRIGDVMGAARFYALALHAAANGGCAPGLAFAEDGAGSRTTPDAGEVSRAAEAALALASDVSTCGTLLSEDVASGRGAEEALLHLAKHWRTCGALELSERFASRLLVCGGAAKEKAKALLRDVRGASMAGHTPPPLGDRWAEDDSEEEEAEEEEDDDDDDDAMEEEEIF